MQLALLFLHLCCDQGALFFPNRCYPKSKQHLLPFPYNSLFHHEAIRRASVRRASRFDSRLQFTSQNCANSFLNQIIHGVQSNPDRCLHIFYSSAGLLQDMLGSSNLFKYSVQKTWQKRMLFSHYHHIINRHIAQSNPLNSFWHYLF